MRFDEILKADLDSFQFHLLLLGWKKSLIANACSRRFFN